MRRGTKFRGTLVACAALRGNPFKKGEIRQGGIIPLALHDCEQKASEHLEQLRSRGRRFKGKTHGAAELNLSANQTFQFLVELLGSLGEGAAEAAQCLVEGKPLVLPPAQARGYCLYDCDVKTEYEPFYVNFVTYSHYQPKLVYRLTAWQQEKARSKEILFEPSLVFAETGHWKLATEAPRAIVFAYPIFVHRLESLFPLWRLLTKESDHQRLLVTEKLYRALAKRTTPGR